MSGLRSYQPALPGDQMVILNNFVYMLAIDMELTKTLALKSENNVEKFIKIYPYTATTLNNADFNLINLPVPMFCTIPEKYKSIHMYISFVDKLIGIELLTTDNVEMTQTYQNIDIKYKSFDLVYTMNPTCRTQHTTFIDFIHEHISNYYLSKHRND